MRFLRAKQMKVEQAAPLYIDFLKWRQANNIDAVRHDILYNGMKSPFDFPNGRKIIDLAPQIVLSAKALDHQGRPLAMETYDFSPKDFYKTVTKEEYMTFLIYSLEYRALVLEQLAHERELAYLAALQPGEDACPGYGQVVLDFTIRDLRGVGLAHMGGEGRALVSAALSLGLPNYPEYLGKCLMINTPWLFSGMWFFIKSFLDEVTVRKISLSGADYLPALLKEAPFESIPAALGGGLQHYNEAFEFDISAAGPFSVATAAAAEEAAGDG